MRAVWTSDAASDDAASDDAASDDAISDDAALADASSVGAMTFGGVATTTASPDKLSRVVSSVCVFWGGCATLFCATFSGSASIGGATSIGRTGSIETTSFQPGGSAGVKSVCGTSEIASSFGQRSRSGPLTLSVSAASGVKFPEIATCSSSEPSALLFSEESEESAPLSSFASWSSGGSSSFGPAALAVSA